MNMHYFLLVLHYNQILLITYYNNEKIREEEEMTPPVAKESMEEEVIIRKSESKDKERMRSIIGVEIVEVIDVAISPCVRALIIINKTIIMIMMINNN